MRLIAMTHHHSSSCALWATLTMPSILQSLLSLPSRVLSSPQEVVAVEVVVVLNRCKDLTLLWIHEWCTPVWILQTLEVVAEVVPEEEVVVRV